MQKTQLPNYLMVKRTTTPFGTSIFATKTIPSGHVLCTTSITNFDYQSGTIISPMGDVFNHCGRIEPNAKITICPDDKTKINILSIKEIESGDEILVNYENNAGRTLTRNQLVEQLNDK